MIYSNNRKLNLSGWLLKNQQYAYHSPLRFQKFLFFYEAFSKIREEEADFEKLRGYRSGPVFSQVWGDYTHNRVAFDSEAQRVYHRDADKINIEFAKSAAFLVNALTEQELSDLTHQYNLWKAKEQRIKSGEMQVALDIKDFSDTDVCLTETLLSLYPMHLIDTCAFYHIGDKNFVFLKRDAERLTEAQEDVLFLLSKQKELRNPVYIEIGESGELIVD